MESASLLLPTARIGLFSLHPKQLVVTLLEWVNERMLKEDGVSSSTDTHAFYRLMRVFLIFPIDRNEPGHMN